MFAVIHFISAINKKLNSRSIFVMAMILVAMEGAPVMSIQYVYGSESLTVPEFPSGAQWINTDRPLTMQELRGRVVLLDFWTYCCINCMHILPDLARLENKYGDRLVVVGVHSAKFDGEKDTDNIRSAVRRYGIRHPVLNDRNFVLWKRLGVHAWPTLVLIDPDGVIVGQVNGEGNYEALDRTIEDVLSRQKGYEKALAPLPLKVEDTETAASFLRFPGKVLADAGGGRLFIADSGHNRIVVADSGTGDVLSIIGSGVPGLKDGDFSDAAFSNPQGIVLAGKRLFVADTDNHALREVDLDNEQVRTVAGNGEQARWGAHGGAGRDTRLNSPWDIEFLDGKLYIAMAGPHQIWRYDPDNGRSDVFAGSGRENIIDGDKTTAALAQPSSITTDGRDLYFADSETSSIRKLSMSNGAVSTLIGTGLFDFGHRDGALKNALLQHPLGVAWYDGGLWVTDTYNNRIKWIDLSGKTIETRAGGSGDGLVDGTGAAARFDEPGGLSAAGTTVFIADTNNHAIRALDTVTGAVRTVELNELIRAPVGKDEFEVHIVPPPGYSVNDEAPSAIDASFGGGSATAKPITQRLTNDSLRVVFKPSGDSFGKTVTFSGDLYICDEGGKGTCYIRPFSFTRKLARDNKPVNDPAAVFSVSPPERSSLP